MKFNRFIKQSEWRRFAPIIMATPLWLSACGGGSNGASAWPTIVGSASAPVEAAAAAPAGAPSPAPSPATAPEFNYRVPNASAQCTALKNTAIENTTISGAEHVEAPDGDYCEITATVAPQTDIQMRLPDAWKGRYLQWGGGGTDGYIPDMTTAESSMLAGGKDPVKFGFAVIASNGGHREAEYPGASFAADRGLTLTYATAKIFDADLVGRTLVQKYYGQAAHYHYFAGCSNGGKNASVAAANFGDRYDGVISGNGPAGLADEDTGGTSMVATAARWVNTAQIGKLDAAKAAALHAKTVEACDRLDGLEDGIISNVGACPVKQIIESMSCSGQGGSTCLTNGEVNRALSMGSPLLINGNPVAAPYSLVQDHSTFGGTDAYAGGFVQMALRTATPVDPTTVDLAQVFPIMKAALDGVYNMTGSLSGVARYIGKGKKLLLFTDWEDAYVAPFAVINFYDALKRADAASTQRNVRLYTNPGNMHCSYNGGAATTAGRGADASDLVHVMAKWVEQGAEPGSAANPTVAWRRPSGWEGQQGPEAGLFTRPLCTFPMYAAYSGQGDAKLASSFHCVQGSVPSQQ